MLGRYHEQLLSGFTPQRERDPDKSDDDAFDDSLEHALREDLRRGERQTAVDTLAERPFGRDNLFDHTFLGMLLPPPLSLLNQSARGWYAHAPPGADAPPQRR